MLFGRTGLLVTDMVLLSNSSVFRLRVVTVSLLHTKGRTQCGVLLSQLVVCPGYPFKVGQYFKLNDLERRVVIAGKYLLHAPNNSR